MEYFLYILKSQKIVKYYVGSSDNADKRAGFHNTIEKGFTARYRPWDIVYKKEFASKKLAQAAERKIKRWKSKKMIEKLIRGEIEL